MKTKNLIFPGLAAMILAGAAGCTTTSHGTIEMPEVVLDGAVSPGTYSAFDIGAAGSAKGAIPMAGTYGEVNREEKTTLLANLATLDALSKQPDTDTLVNVHVNGSIEVESTIDWISGQRTSAGLGEITVYGTPVRRLPRDASVPPTAPDAETPQKESQNGN